MIYLVIKTESKLSRRKHVLHSGKAEKINTDQVSAHALLRHDESGSELNNHCKQICFTNPLKHGYLLQFRDTLDRASLNMIMDHYIHSV